MLQHNPHTHSIRCVALAVTLDGRQTRELAPEEARAVPCVECDCRLMGAAEKRPARKAK